MSEPGSFRQGLREINAEDVCNIQQVVALFPKLSRHSLAQTLCEHLNWHSPSGALKVRNCLMLLDQLDNQGLLVLPKKSARGRLTPDKRTPLTSRTNEQQKIKGTLSEFNSIDLEPVVEKSKIGLWNEYVERYHNR